MSRTSIQNMCDKNILQNVARFNFLVTFLTTDMHSVTVESNASKCVSLKQCLVMLVKPTLTFMHERHFISNGPHTRYVKLRVAHAPGMPGTFFPPPILKETASYRSQPASRHVRDARAVMYVGIANLRCRGKRSRHSQRMHNPQFYVSGKRSITRADDRRVRWHLSMSQCLYELMFLAVIKNICSNGGFALK